MTDPARRLWQQVLGGRGRALHAGVVAVVALLLGLGALAVLAGIAAAHGGSLRGTQQSLAVPQWLFLVTGGSAVGASFLLASFVTDRAFVRQVHEPLRDFALSDLSDSHLSGSDPSHRGLALPNRLGPVVLAAARFVGVLGLVAVLVVGFVGPADPLSNLAVLVVWGGWWAGFTMTTYLVGNTWPALNPWRTVADWLPSLDHAYPERFGAWPAAVGLLALVWIEVVSPLADDPRMLAGVVAAYTVATLAGAVAFGPDTWFGRVDPISQVFHAYGRVAPLGRAAREVDARGIDARGADPRGDNARGNDPRGDDARGDDARGDGPDAAAGGLQLRWPGSALAEAPTGDEGETGLLGGPGGVAFVVALLWATTYDGFVATPLWRDAATAIVSQGVPVHLLYPVVLLGGWLVFLGAFRLSARSAKRRSRTYLPVATLSQRFAPSLLAIAAGYHLAHYLGYFLQLLPSLAGALTAPMGPPEPVYLVLSDWFGGLELAAVLVGHWLAVWVAHGVAYDLFPSRLQAARSQYALTAVMIAYTVTSLLIVSQPYVDPPFIS